MSFAYNTYLLGCQASYKNKSKNIYMLDKIESLNFNFPLLEKQTLSNTIKNSKNNQSDIQLNFLLLFYITLLKKTVITYNSQKGMFLFNNFFYKKDITLFFYNLLGLHRNVTNNFFLFKKKLSLLTNFYFFKSTPVLSHKFRINSKVAFDVINLKNFNFFFNFKLRK